MGYGCLIWSGAAVTHLIERIQHRFLMWLASKTQETCGPLDCVCVSLLELLGPASVNSRFTQMDLMFLRSGLPGTGQVDCDDAVGMFPLSVPCPRMAPTSGTCPPSPRAVPRASCKWTCGYCQKGFPGPSFKTVKLSGSQQPSDRLPLSFAIPPFR